MTDATEGEKDNIWHRLRRRKVVQWGIAYAAGCAPQILDLGRSDPLRARRRPEA